MTESYGSVKFVWPHQADKILLVKIDHSDRLDRSDIACGFPLVQPDHHGMTDKVGTADPNPGRPGSDRCNPRDSQGESRPCALNCVVT